VLSGRLLPLGSPLLILNADGRLLECSQYPIFFLVVFDARAQCIIANTDHFMPDSQGLSIIRNSLGRGNTCKCCPLIQHKGKIEWEIPLLFGHNNSGSPAKRMTDTQLISRVDIGSRKVGIQNPLVYRFVDNLKVLNFVGPDAFQTGVFNGPSLITSYEASKSNFLPVRKSVFSPNP